MVTNYLARGLAMLAGYAIALALVLVVLMAGCNAAFSGTPATPTAPTYVAPTYTPETPALVTPAPRQTTRPRPTTQPRAIPEPSQAWDCGDADPNDPEIDPEIDCVPA